MITQPLTPPLVSLRKAGKTYKNGTVALGGLNLDVHSGEFLTLLGPSGCGKSTILRLIAGLDTVSSGTLTRSFAPDRASIGFVFQDPTLMPWASVFDNVFLGLRLQGLSRREAAPRVGEVLALVGLAAVERGVPARTFRRHAHAGFDRPGARLAPAAAFDGRALRRARRDHAVSGSMTICCGCKASSGRRLSSSPIRSTRASICQAGSR